MSELQYEESLIMSYEIVFAVFLNEVFNLSEIDKLMAEKGFCADVPARYRKIPGLKHFFFTSVPAVETLSDEQREVILESFIVASKAQEQRENDDEGSQNNSDIFKDALRVVTETYKDVMAVRIVTPNDSTEMYESKQSEFGNRDTEINDSKLETASLHESRYICVGPYNNPDFTYPEGDVVIGLSIEPAFDENGKLLEGVSEEIRGELIAASREVLEKDGIQLMVL